MRRTTFSIAEEQTDFEFCSIAQAYDKAKKKQIKIVPVLYDKIGSKKVLQVKFKRKKNKSDLLWYKYSIKRRCALVGNISEIKHINTSSQAISNEYVIKVISFKQF